jgi:hypothetical protein
VKPFLRLLLADAQRRPRPGRPGVWALGVRFAPAG